MNKLKLKISAFKKRIATFKKLDPVKHTLLVVVTTVCLISAGSILVVYAVQKIPQLMAKSSSIVSSSSSSSPSLVSSSQSQSEETEDVIDFEALQKQNPDVVAWIRVDDTNIDYPILCHQSNDLYYLDHTIDGKYDIAGAVFIQQFNSGDFSDPNTVVYGHNMLTPDGTMFTQLRLYKTQDFFDKHRTLTIYMPDETYHYKIFAAHEVNDDHIMLTYDFYDKQVFSDYTKAILNKTDKSSIVDKTVKITSADKIITLSTCVTLNGDRRYLVQGVLVDEER